MVPSTNLPASHRRGAGAHAALSSATPNSLTRSLGAFTRAVILATAFEAQRRILRSVIAAKTDLGLDPTHDCQELAEMSYEGPTVFATVRIAGWKDEPMYDEPPDFASFTMPIAKVVELGPRTLEHAKAMLQSRLLLDTWFGRWAGYELPLPPDLSRGITCVALLDNLGNVVAEADFDPNTGVRWLTTPTMTGIEMDQAEARAHELEREAAFEAGWDNFSTAEHLREQAAALRRRVSIARHAPRLACGGEK